MNKTEARYAKILEARRLSGEIIGWRFEPFSVKLTPNTFYKPDFLVASDVLEIHEVKGGYILEDAMVKYKLAKERLPWFRFRLVQY